ncbi:hypothetical protein [Holophaga foetida]|uniref:hypothetical protein n=1 Tax=Holophaga foetida TaxID=35839 RepID=UPI000479C70A|nr:hypothetical protein [Holophaga foetida]
MPGLRLVEAPMDERWMEVVGPDGRCLAVLPDAQFYRKIRRGTWPEGARIRTYFLTSTGRRVTLARWDWTASELAMEREGGPEPSIRIMPDYGGAYAWDQYERCAELVDLLDEGPEVVALGTELAVWQGEWEAHAAFTPEDDPPPPGGWDAWAERGLELCRHALTLMGPEGVLIYRCPPSRLRCGKRDLVLYWERQVDVNQNAHDREAVSGFEGRNQLP